MIKIGPVCVGKSYQPFIVAEMSANHNQSLERALGIVDAAADAGVHAVKIQTATPDGLTLNVKGKDFLIKDKKSLWDGRYLFELYEQASTPWCWHEAIFERCQEKKLLAFSSPFDSAAVDYLDDLNVPCYKIASFENADLPLIRRVAATGKPVILSIGMASLAELDESVRTLREGGCDDIVLLKCTSTYPASPENSNLNTIPHLRDLFGCEVGLSDHTHGIGAGVAAVALGATLIEKHFTLSRAEGGVDSAFSMEPAEMAGLVTETQRAWQALGGIHYGMTEAEKLSAQFRRSIYIAQDVKSGDVLTSENLRVIRPGYGLEPKYYEILLGRRINRDLPKGSAMDWSYV